MLLHLVDPTDGGCMDVEVLVPKRDGRIFGSRYWNTGCAAVAVVAVYGGRARWRCLNQNCRYSLHIDSIQPLNCPLCGDVSVEIAGDWAAYIDACLQTQYQEQAENFVRRFGDKLDKGLAEYIFAAELETRDGLVYRR